MTWIGPKGHLQDAGTSSGPDRGSEGVPHSCEVDNLRQQAQRLQGENAGLRDHVCMLQRLIDAHVQSAKPATAHAVNGSRYKAHVSVLPPEAAMLTEGTRTMVAGWAIKHHAALNTYLSPDPLFLYKMLRDMLLVFHKMLQQDEGCHEARLAMRLVWNKSCELVSYGQLKRPEVMAVIGERMRQTNARKSRRELITAHFNALAGCRLDQAQAEAIAVVAQEFQEGQTRVLQQRTECAAALRQDQEAQVRLGSGCSTAQSLALEERLQHLQVQERVQTQQLLRSLFSPAGLWGFAGASLVVGLQGPCLDVHMLATIILDQVNRYCTVSLLRQARLCHDGAPPPSDDQAAAASWEARLQPRAVVAAAPRAAQAPSSGQAAFEHDLFDLLVQLPSKRRALQHPGSPSQPPAAVADCHHDRARARTPCAADFQVHAAQHGRPFSSLCRDPLAEFDSLGDAYHPDPLVRGLSWPCPEALPEELGSASRSPPRQLPPGQAPADPLEAFISVPAPAPESPLAEMEALMQLAPMAKLARLTELYSPNLQAPSVPQGPPCSMMAVPDLVADVLPPGKAALPQDDVAVAAVPVQLPPKPAAWPPCPAAHASGPFWGAEA